MTHVRSPSPVAQTHISRSAPTDGASGVNSTKTADQVVAKTTAAPPFTSSLAKCVEAQSKLLKAQTDFAVAQSQAARTKATETLHRAKAVAQTSEQNQSRLVRAIVQQYHSIAARMDRTRRGGQALVAIGALVAAIVGPLTAGVGAAVGAAISAAGGVLWTTNRASSADQWRSAAAELER